MQPVTSIGGWLETGSQLECFVEASKIVEEADALLMSRHFKDVSSKERMQIALRIRTLISQMGGFFTLRHDLNDLVRRMHFTAERLTNSCAEPEQTPQSLRSQFQNTHLSFGESLQASSGNYHKIDFELPPLTFDQAEKIITQAQTELIRSIQEAPLGVRAKASLEILSQIKTLRETVKLTSENELASCVYRKIAEMRENIAVTTSIKDCQLSMVETFSAMEVTMTTIPRKNSKPEDSLISKLVQDLQSMEDKKPQIEELVSHTN